jgi:3-methyladenine DNA glycosylase AlkD
VLLTKLKQDLHKLANPQKAKLLARFFKTGRGEYGEGDIFLGIIVPEQRKIATKYKNLSLSKLEQLLKSKIHEERLINLFILVNQFQKANPAQQKTIFNFYLKNTNYINNWDLVDLSAPDIVGQYILENSEAKPVLYKLAKSSSLWERRISVLATFAFIKAKNYKDSLKIAKKLLKDKHDLIHKACGWMLREVGKRDKKLLREFLDQHCRQMPRTMLRYAIEKLDQKTREYYLRL